MSKKLSLAQREYNKLVGQYKRKATQLYKDYFIVPKTNYINVSPKRVSKTQIQSVRKKLENLNDNLYIIDPDTGEVVRLKTERGKHLYSMAKLRNEKKQEVKKEAKRLKSEAKQIADDWRKRHGQSVKKDTPSYYSDAGDSGDAIYYNNFPSENNIIIENFLSTIESQFPNGHGTNLIIQGIRNAIKQQGEDAVAQAIQEFPLDTISRQQGYSKEMAIAFLQEFLTYIPDIGEMEQDEILEAFQEEENWITYD